MQCSILLANGISNVSHVLIDRFSHVSHVERSVSIDSWTHGLSHVSHVKRSVSFDLPSLTNES